MTTTTRLDLPIVLPGVPDAKDACVARLEKTLAGNSAISKSMWFPPAPANPHYSAFTSIRIG